MKLAEVQAAESRLLLQTYDRYPLLLERGEGVYLFDADGRRYLDLLSGIGVAALGYGHPANETALREQGSKLLHTSNLFFHRGTAELAAKLTQMSGLDRVFLTNSGTEAWEGALKLARAYAQARAQQHGAAPRTRFLALEHSFHGRTMGSVATTHKERYRLPFMPVMPDVDFVRFNDVKDLQAKFTDEVCAICVETVQGEGGIHPVSREFLEAARGLTRDADALLLCDEIQCGLGRTGRWFAYQHYDVLPDLATVAKPLGGGYPVGALLATERAAAAFSPGMHGTTFGGSPLACAVALAVINAIDREHLLKNVDEVGGYLLEALAAMGQKHPEIRSVRGIGLMVGVEMASADLAKAALQALLDQGYILNRTSETVLRLLPPYIITCREIDDFLVAFNAVLAGLKEQPVVKAAAEEEFHE